MNKTVLALVAAGSIGLASTSYAFGSDKDCSHSKHHFGKFNLLMMEHMLDLNDQQLDEIKDLKENNKGKQRKQQKLLMKQMMDLDPANPDYMNKVKSLAEQKAQHIKEQMIRRAEIRAKIYKILTPEQQEEFRAIKEKMNKRMERSNRS